MFTEFKVNVAHETYVIVGNCALLKCDIPSFVADLVSVVSWHDNGGAAYQIGSESYGNWLRYILRQYLTLRSWNSLITSRTYLSHFIIREQFSQKVLPLRHVRISGNVQVRHPQFCHGICIRH